MAQPIKWIFFDCFNTLVDDFDETGDQSGVKPLGQRCAEAGVFDHSESFHQAYLQWRSMQWVSASWHEVDLLDRIRGTLALGKKPEMDLEQLSNELMEIFHQTYPSTLRAVSGAAEMLDRLGSKYKTGLVSNFFLPGYPGKVLESFDLHHTFDFILDSAQVGHKKPGKEFYLAAMQKAGVAEADTNQILFVGDSLLNDVITPQNLGMQAIHFDRSADVPNAKPTPGHLPSITSWDQFMVSV